MYRHPDASAGGDQQYQLSANSATSSFHSSAFGFSPFSATGILEPSPQSSISHHLSPLFRLSPARHGAHQRHHSISSQTGAMGPPSTTASPRMTPAAPPRAHPTASYHPTDRSLPSTNVTADTIADAYVAFVLYCNPNFPLDTDTTTLRTTFRSPPKSDNKEFDVFRLYELIQKYEAKEIKTWNQLALDLGVEPPDTSRGQSVQKVQQYSVRLKRWMRAMHVDAFFEYLLGKQHPYCTDIPPPDDAFPANGRDGVPADDDLAIRALDPSFRPKRGRRRNSEAELDNESDAGQDRKQPRLADGSLQHLHPPSAAPGSAIPMSAHPGASHDPWTAASAVTPQSFAPWANRAAEPQSAVSATGPAQFRWQLTGSTPENNTPHPMSAHPNSMSAHIDEALDAEPQSAVTPAGRKRRKHGPAVSSAWPSNAGPGAKPRGRPPASRIAQDGPFTTFPADPAQNGSHAGNRATPPPPSAVSQPMQQFQQQNYSEPLQTLASRQLDGVGRAGRLSLQVPPHTGAPVRLATPPRFASADQANNAARPDARAHLMQTPVQPTAPPTRRIVHTVGDVDILERPVPGFAFEALKRVLTTDLLRAELVGRNKRLSGDEAKRLAQTVLDRLGIPQADTDNSRDDISRLTAASWLGLGEQLRVPLGPAVGRNKRIVVTRFRLDADGYEEVISADDENDDNTSHDSHSNLPATETRETFDLSWNVGMGGCNGAFELKGLSLGPAVPRPEDTHDLLVRTWLDHLGQAGVGGEWAKYAIARAEHDPIVIRAQQRIREEGAGVDWQAKYMEAMFGAKMARGELMRIRDGLIDKVLDVLI